MEAQHTDSKPKSELRHPFGRVLPKRSYFIAWSVVLAVSILDPGLKYQIGTSGAVFHSYRYVTSTLLMVAVAGFVLLVIRLFASGRSGWSLRVGSTVMLMLFMWPTFAKFDSVWVVGTLLVVGVPATVIVVVALHGDRVYAASIVVLLAMFALGFSVYQMSSRGVADPTTEMFASSAGDAAGDLPDALFILLDGYGRKDALESLYGFDNSGFLGGIAQLGFDVDDHVVSNYNRTYASVSSMMDLGYPVEAGPVTTLSRQTIRGHLGQRGSLISAFEMAGYEFTYTENAWLGSRCGAVIDECWRVQVTRTNAYYLSLLTPFAPLVRDRFAHPVHATSWAQINQLSEVVLGRTARDRPQWIWAHFVLPHAPVYLDATCDRHLDTWRHGLALTGGGSTDELRRSAYIEQTRCTNDTLIRELEQILAENPGMAIFLFSDHGPDGQQQVVTLPDGMSPEQIAERYAALLAVRMPDSCATIDAVSTLVNGLRNFTGCVLGLDVAQLRDRAFIVPYFDREEAVLEFDLSLLNDR